MKVGIIGAGEISRFHIAFCKEKPKVEIQAICDVNIVKTECIAQEFRIPNVFRDVSSMLSSSRLDVVHILTPPNSHAELAVKAMEAGCHVLIEKPMALSVEDAEKMVATAKREKVKLCVCHQYKFDPMVNKLRELINFGRIGETIFVENYWFTDINQGSNAYTLRGNNRGWAYNLPGNVFANFLDHPIYLQKEFLKQVTSVSVSTKKVGDNPFIPYDEIRIQLEGPHSNGSIISSLNIKPRLNILRIYGTKMIATADMSNMTFSTLPAKNLPHMFSKGYINFNHGYQLISDTIINSIKVLSGKIKARQGLREFIDKFYESIMSNTELPVSPAEGLENIEILSKIWSKTEKSTRDRRDAFSIKKDSDTNKITTSPLQKIVLSGTYSKKQKRVLVTGATGFLGSHLVDRLLVESYHVRVLVRKIKREYIQNPKIEVIYGDIRNNNSLKEAIKGIDLVFHCAGKVTNRGTWEDFHETNIDTTRCLLDLSIDADVKRLIYVSSVVIYGFKKRNGTNLITEKHPHANDLGKYYYYAKSKIEAEKLVLDYFDKYKLPVTITRPGILYGPRGKNIFKNKKVIVGQGNKILPYTYVENLVDALILSSTKEVAIGQAYNIVDDEQLTQKQFFEIVAAISNTKMPGIFVPMPITYLSALFFEYLAKRKNSKISPPLSMYIIDSIRRNLIYDTKKAKEELGWNQRFPVKEGIKKTFIWFKKTGGLQ